MRVPPGLVFLRDRRGDPIVDSGAVGHHDVGKERLFELLNLAGYALQLRLDDEQQRPCPLACRLGCAIQPLLARQRAPAAVLFRHRLHGGDRHPEPDHAASHGELDCEAIRLAVLRDAPCAGALHQRDDLGDRLLDRHAGALRVGHQPTDSQGVQLTFSIAPSLSDKFHPPQGVLRETEGCFVGKSRERAAVS